MAEARGNRPRCSAKLDRTQGNRLGMAVDRFGFEADRSGIEVNAIPQVVKGFLSLATGAGGPRNRWPRAPGQPCAPVDRLQQAASLIAACHDVAPARAQAAGLPLPTRPRDAAISSRIA
jgi:hypothetical protein